MAKALALAFAFAFAIVLKLQLLASVVFVGDALANINAVVFLNENHRRWWRVFKKSISMICSSSVSI